MQPLVSVILVLITVMSMQLALTEMEVLTVSVLLATVAMEHTVMVRNIWTSLHNVYAYCFSYKFMYTFNDNLCILLMNNF